MLFSSDSSSAERANLATVISHGIAALALGKLLTPEPMPGRFWIASVICATLPDIDVLGFPLGIQYGDMLGHRGLTHSLTFALALSCIVVGSAFRDTYDLPVSRFLLIIYFFIVTASHGMLDALTNGGLGVAFFAPFSNTRYFFPWRPIEVSPIGLEPFLTARGLEVIVGEIKWIWIPSLVLVAARSLYSRIF